MTASTTTSGLTVAQMREHIAALHDLAKTDEIVALVNAERERVARLISSTKAVNEATGKLGLMCAASRPALRLNAGLQRAYRHDVLVASGVFPRKLTGRQMDVV